MKSKSIWSLLPLFIVVAIIGLTFSSCNNQKKAKVAQEEIKQDIEEYVYPLASAFDVTTMLSEIEASYIVDITNDAGNVEKYFTEQSRAVNLGVYTADLAYATTYRQKADVQSYFKAIQILVNELDITAAISKHLAEDIESNLDNQEVLVKLITQLTENAYSYLNKQGRAELSYLVLAGTAIEGLYLSTHISENTFQNPQIIKTILYQKEPLMKLAKLMEPFKDSELSASVYSTVQSINEVYALNESTSSMTLEQIETLTQVLDQLREESVQ
ncbi:MAG: hypothetical protein ACERKD_05295 [Prolixibacteraceae bacterium]